MYTGEASWLPLWLPLCSPVHIKKVQLSVIFLCERVRSVGAPKKERGEKKKGGGGLEGFICLMISRLTKSAGQVYDKQPTGRA